MNRQHLVFVTVITRDYYWWARTWADSVREHHPAASVCVAFADHPTGDHLQCFDDCQTMTLPEISTELGIEKYRRMAFQYTPFELTCALKPFVMRYLHQWFQNVIYFDADIQVYRPLNDLINRLSEAEIVATPHLANATLVSRELGIRAAGVLNGGFVGTSYGNGSAEFLNWWSERCRTECCVDPYAGKFVDQSWLDLAINYFDSMEVLRDDGLNVAYWNLANRQITSENQRFLVNSQPLGFFHFSGFDPVEPKTLSRFDQHPVEESLELLLGQYATRLKSNQKPKLDCYPCEYQHYSDGQKVDPVHREAIRGEHPDFLDVENPFDLSANPEWMSQVAAHRESLILSRKHWQLEELQRLADIQTEWIKKRSRRRLDKRLMQALRRVLAFVTGHRVSDHPETEYGETDRRDTDQRSSERANKAAKQDRVTLKANGKSLSSWSKVA